MRNKSKNNNLVVSDKKNKKRNRKSEKNISDCAVNEDKRKRRRRYESSELVDVGNMKKCKDVKKNGDNQDPIRCLFEDVIDDPFGDARKDFLKIDVDHTCYIWCIKDGHRLFPKLCGRRVTKKCKSKLKCEYYEYGMEIKCKYNLKLLSTDDKKLNCDNFLSLSDTDGKDLYEDS